MNPVFRLLLIAVVGSFVIAGAEFLRAKPYEDLSPYPTAGGELETGGYDDAPDRMPEHGAKVALGNNANAVLSLDLISDGGAGNRRDDGVTTGGVSGRGTKIAIEVFATGVRTSLLALSIEFDFDATLLSFVKAENSAFAVSIPEGSAGIFFGALPVVTLTPSGFLARAEFETVVDVRGRVVSIGINRVLLGDSNGVRDTLTTASAITFNAAPSPDFDGDDFVGFTDFLIFAGAFGSRQGDGRYNAAQDLNSDGSVDFTDFLIFAGAFGSEVPPSGGGGTPSDAGDAVTIVDANLRAVIADSLGKAPDAPITREEMAMLTRFAAPNKGIRSLSGLEHATNLQWLALGSEHVNDEWVNSNDISDLSPLANLTNLTALVLHSNSISNISALSDLTNLTYLSLTSNRISSISSLSNLTNLTQLHLGGNQSISDIAPLSNLTRLTRLNLWGNNISNIAALSNLTRLTLLNLGRTKVNGEWVHNNISDLSPLSRLTNLTYLSLTSNRISSISSLSNLTNLTQLHLGGNQSISDIAALINLTRLTRLNLWGNNIPDISALSQLTDLSDLGLSSNRISDISPLVTNSGLGDGDTVNLKSNPLSSTSRNTHIPTLQRRGVKVEFDSSDGNGGGGVRACTAGLVVNPGESCTYKGNTFSVSSSGRGSIAFFNAGTGIDARGATINGVRWNFHATKNSGSNSWTIHVAD